MQRKPCGNVDLVLDAILKMDGLDQQIFDVLFRDAFQKCFGLPLTVAISEIEAKIFCNKLLDETGLSIGWKSVKNYSIFITGGAAGRHENPSVATLDTLARYVLEAPHTTELQRKNDESHFPYWFLYRQKFISVQRRGKTRKRITTTPIIIAAIAIIAVAKIYFMIFYPTVPAAFTDDFKQVDDATLTRNGWSVKSKDAAYWNKRTQAPGELTLFTLKGDNWPSPSAKPGINNLLMREINYDCFTAEVHLDSFMPTAEWQQAGILLTEDTTLTGRSIRLSLAFNDYFGGRKMPSEIYVQLITSLGHGFGKPEEVAHQSLFYPDSLKANPLLTKNFNNSALRIEKHGNKFRFLYSLGASENGAFRQVASQEIDIKPKYIAIFAIKGFTNSAVIPVKFKLFKISAESCQ